MVNNDWILDYPFDPEVNYHLSIKPIPRYIETITQEVGMKPRGLWYGCGNSWLDWLESEMPQWLDQGNYLYEMWPGDNLLYLRHADDLDRFTRQYGVKQYGNDYHIDWLKVADRHAGIEICPYHYSRRLSLYWYYTWDVASGCIWGKGNHLVNLVAQRH